MNSIEAAAMPDGVGRNLQPWLVGGLAAAASVVAIKYAQRNRVPREELQKASLLPYCADIVEVLGDSNYAVVGGLPIDAFNHTDTITDFDAHTITVSENFDTLLLRKTNNTVRDYDIFRHPKDSQGNFKVPADEDRRTIKQALTSAAKKRAEQNSQPAPVMSVFLFDTKTSLFHTATTLGKGGQISLQQGTVKQTLPAGAMQTWELVLPDGLHLKVLNPWEQYWRSMVRFSSGVKTKDQPKLNSMLAKLRATPGLSEMENSDLCRAYGDYHQKMLAGNSPTTFLTEFKNPGRDWERVAHLGLLTLARTIMAAGEKNDFVSRVVQGTPRVFDHFVGGA